MLSWRRFFAKLARLFHRRRTEEDLAREVASHLALLEEDFQRRGLTPTEASQAARRAYGSVDHAKELHRDEWSFLWIECAWQDLRHAYRGLARSPGFVAVAVVSLAFGIGVNTAIFTLINGILLKKLPVPEPERIVQLQARGRNFDTTGLSFPVFQELRRQEMVFEDVIGFSPRPAILDIDGDPRKIDLNFVTGTYFPFFSARPVMGRLLNEEDDLVESASRVCVLSYEAWRTHFNGDPRILDQMVRIEGIELRVVGVISPDFVGAELQRRYDVWVPAALHGPLYGIPRERRFVAWLRVLARLKPGMLLEQANALLQAASPSIEESLPGRRTNRGAVYQLRDASKGFDTWRSELRDPLLILMGAVVLVLLVACANLANLLLARSNDRNQEFAIKLALGISRGRLLRQLMVETFMLAFAGGGLAVLLAFGLTEFLLTTFNAGNRYQMEVEPDVNVFLFTLGACVLTALIAGLYPARQASRGGVGPGLKGTSVSGFRRSLVRRALIVIQVTLTIVLLFGASLFTHSLSKLKAVNLGFDIDRILSVELERSGPRNQIKTALKLLRKQFLGGCGARRGTTGIRGYVILLKIKGLRRGATRSGATFCPAEPDEEAPRHAGGTARLVLRRTCDERF